MELFNGAIMTECIGPPPSVLYPITKGGVGRYEVHAIPFEGTEEFPSLFSGSEAFFFFFGVG